MPRPLFRVLAAAATTAGAGALVLLPATAHAAPAVSSVDETFMTANEQSNLAELSLGALTQQRSSNQQSLDLASMTIKDHTTAKGLVTQLAQQLGVTLPDAPNATQQSQAAALQASSAADFDHLYAQIQVTGHELSIASTQQELSSGTNDQVKQYAQTYLPLAQMHLQMAQAELTALGGPISIPAGSGGLASTTGAGSHGWEYGVAGGLVAAAAGAVALRRSRPGQHRDRASASGVTVLRS